MARINDIKTILSLAKVAKFTPCFIGIEGVGKTESHVQWASENNYELITFRLGQIDDGGEIGGLPHVTTSERGQRVVEYVRLKMFDLDPSKNYLIHLDEINRTKPQVLNAVFQLIENPAGLNNVKFGDNVMVSASANPFTDDFNGLDLSTEKALADRLAFVKVVPSFEDWASYALAKGLVDKGYIEFLRNKPNYFIREYEDFNLDFVKPSTRSHVTANRIIRASDYNPDVYGLILPGIIGTPATLDLIANNELLRKGEIPSGEELLFNYDKAVKSIDFEDATILAQLNDEIVHLFLHEPVQLTDVCLDSIKKWLYAIPQDIAVGLMKRMTVEVFFRADGKHVHNDKRRFPCLVQLDRMFLDYIDSKPGLAEALVEGIKKTV